MISEESQPLRPYIINFNDLKCKEYTNLQRQKVVQQFPGTIDGEAEREAVCSYVQVSFGTLENILKLDYGDSCTTL